MTESRADIFEERRQRLGHSFQHGGGSSLVAFIQAFWLSIGHDTAFAATPGYFDSKPVGTARGKNTHGIIAREIPPAADHFLALGHGAAKNSDARANTARVRRQAFEPNRQAGSRTVITV